MVRGESSGSGVGVRRVVSLAWPIVVTMLSYNVMTLADAVFVGRIGTAALAAVGLAAVVLHAGYSMGIGLMGGLRVVVARHTGAERHREASGAGWQVFWIAGVVGVLTLAVVPLGEPVMRAMGGSDEVLAEGLPYLWVRLLSAPVLFAMFGFGSWFSGRGDTRTPMVANLVGNVVNIALDPVFIFGLGPVPAMGTAGAAIATVLGQCAAVAIYALRGRRDLRVVRPSIDGPVLREVWRLGAPIGVRQLLEVSSWGLFASALAQAGEAHLAAHVLVVRIICVSFLPGLAVSEAAGILVGQAMGAGRLEEARQAWWVSTWLAVILMVAGGILFVAVPEVLVRPFGVEPDVVDIAVDLLWIAAGFQVFDAVATVALGAINGAGDTRFSMVLSIGSAWLVKVPVALWLALPMGLGAVGAWLGLTAELVVLSVIAVWRIRSGRWLGDVSRLAGELSIAR